MCNKLASRHVRVRLAESKAVPCCDICENSPAFFYCEIDGSSLCLQCNMVVHVGGKRTHGRYLLLRQRVEFPTDKPGHFEDPASQSTDQVPAKRRANPYLQKHRNSSGPVLDSSPHGNEPAESKMIDLNIKPQRMLDNPSNNQQWNHQHQKPHSMGGITDENFSYLLCWYKWLIVSPFTLSTPTPLNGSVVIKPAERLLLVVREHLRFVSWGGSVCVWSSVIIHSSMSLSFLRSCKMERLGCRFCNYCILRCNSNYLILFTPSVQWYGGVVISFLSCFFWSLIVLGYFHIFIQMKPCKV